MLSYGFMQNAIVISFFIAIICPSIGIFLVLRRYAMIGDTLAHASLAGAALGIATGQNPIIGAFVFTSLCGVLIEFLRAYFRRYTDLILNIVLSFSIGIAITLISSGRLNMSADAFLFGSVLTVTDRDMMTVIVLSVLAVGTLLLLYNQLIYIAYDEDAAKIVGVKVKRINYIFAMLVAAAIAVSIRIVGVLVLSSMIALPVATALQLEKGFKLTLIFSIIFSITDIMVGLVGAYYLNVAPGGFTALVSVFILLSVIIIKAVMKRQPATTDR